MSAPPHPSEVSRSPANAFHPPDTLSQEDIRAVADVRRSLWSAGFRGLAWGLMGGGALVFGLRRAPLRQLGLGMLEEFRSKSHAFVIVMGCGAAVSFVSALTAGRNAMYLMQPVFERGKFETLTPYQKALVQDNRIELTDEQRLLQRMAQTHRERMERMAREQ